MEGVAALPAGPGDPSADTGAMGAPGAVHVRDAVAPVRGATAAGGADGIPAPPEADAGRHLAGGSATVAPGSDGGPLARGSDAPMTPFGR